MLRSVAVLAICIVSTSAVAQLPKAPVERERVYILADSLEWVLAFHDVPESRTVACHLTTRVQPGARYTRWWDGDGLKSFTVYLMQTTGALERFALSVDDEQPFSREPSAEERRHKVLRLRGAAHAFLVGADTLRVRALFSNGEHQDLTFDLQGFNALYERASRFDCFPYPRVPPGLSPR